MKKSVVIISSILLLLFTSCENSESKTINIEYGNLKYEVQTKQQLLTKFLYEIDVKIDDNDIVEVNGDKIEYNLVDMLEIKNSDKIKIILVTIKEIEDIIELNYTQEVKYDDNRAVGVELIETEGKNGYELVMRKEVYHNDVLKDVIVEKKRVEPLNEIKLVGTKIQPETNSSNAEGSNFSGGGSTGGSAVTPIVTPPTIVPNVPETNTSQNNCSITINGVEYPCD